VDDIQRQAALRAEAAAHAQRETDAERRRVAAEQDAYAANLLAHRGRALTGVLDVGDLSLEAAHVVTLEEDFLGAVTVAIHITAERVEFPDMPANFDGRLYRRLADKITDEQGSCWVPENWPVFVGPGEELRTVRRISMPVGRIIEVHLIPLRGSFPWSGGWDGLGSGHPTPAELSGLRISWLARCL
jgi:hypothetical protein